MALTTNPARRKGMTILASDLSGAVTFDVKQTLPVMDMTSGSYDAGTAAYLKMVGVTQLDAQYNAAVQAFEQQLQEQELASKLQANFAAAAGADQAVESQPGLGTGAGAIASEGRQSALQAMHGMIEQQTMESYQAGVENLSASYGEQLENILGKYDPVTGTYAGLTEYDSIGMMAGDAIADALAFMINPNPDEKDTTESILVAAGLAESINGDLSLTTAGETMLKRVVNGLDVNEEQAELGGKTLIDFMARKMAMQDHPNWDEISSDRQDTTIAKYANWLEKNFDFLRVSHWDMYEEAGDFIIPDIMPDTSVGSGTYILDAFAGEEDTPFENVDGVALADVKQRVLNGEIPDGAYFTIGEKGKYFYVKDYIVYETEYTTDNPPDEIPVNSAIVTSFGHFLDSGTGKGEQDKYVQAIIDKAKAGQLAENTIVQMNFGYATNRYIGWYQYRDGTFYKLSGDFRVGYGVRLKDLNNVARRDKYNYDIIMSAEVDKWQ